jgi:hypothetical protein
MTLGTVINSGTVTANGNNNLGVAGIDVTNTGTISSVNGVGLFSFGNVINDGTILGGVAAIETDDQDNTVTLGDHSLTVGNILTGQGDDTVITQASVSYATACGDIGVAQGHAATVNGVIDGGADSDTLNLSVFGSDSGAFGGSGSISNGAGGTYDWTGFENVNINYLSYDAGPARLFDDGVIQAFATPGGIAVCSGAQGQRAGTISFADLDQGVRDFSANGFTVHVTDLGGGQYQVSLLENGQPVMNDANGDGQPDSAFIFTH